MRGIRLYSIEIGLVFALLASIGFFGYLGYGLLTRSMFAEPFSGERALVYVGQQLEFGDRITGTEASKETTDWLVDELTNLGWDVVIQEYNVANVDRARNIIAINGELRSDGRIALLGAHYDTRKFADSKSDPNTENHLKPVPGANGNASGVAVLLELARTLNLEEVDHTVCLAFFDGESNLGLPNWESAQGSLQLVQNMATDKLARCNQPRFAIILERVGGGTQQLYMDRSGALNLSTAIWQTAQELGHDDQLVAEPKWTSPQGAHIAFINAQIPTSLIVGYDYPYHHTINDTLDKVNANSLEGVGDTLKVWLEEGADFTR